MYNVVSIAALARQLPISFKTNHTTVLSGPPGSGKTNVCRQIARDYLRSVYGVDPDQHFFYYNGATKTMEWSGGIMMPDGEGGCDQMIPGWFKRIPDKAIVLIDELDKLSLRDQMPLLQILHEKSIDNVKLGSKVHFIVCVNRLTDRGGSSGLNPLLGNRCRNLAFTPKPDEVLMYFAQTGVHHMVYNYLQQNPNRINAYDTGTVDGRNCTSRSWEQASDALKCLGDGAPTFDVLCTVAASVPDSDAQNFQLFNELGSELTSFADVMANPKKAKVPDKSNRGLQYLQVNMIASQAAGMKTGDKYQIPGTQTFMTRGQCKEAAYWYAKRFPVEFLQAVVPLILLPAVDAQQKGGPAIPAGLGGDAAAELLKMHADKRAILNDEAAPVTTEE